MLMVRFSSLPGRVSTRVAFAARRSTIRGSTAGSTSTTPRVTGTLKKFEETVAKIENHKFSNAKVVKCARLCDGCDMRFYCNYK